MVDYVSHFAQFSERFLTTPYIPLGNDPENRSEAFLFVLRCVDGADARRTCRVRRLSYGFGHPVGERPAKGIGSDARFIGRDLHTRSSSESFAGRMHARLSFQLSRQSSMLMWCKSPNGERNVASHTTTSHLRYVDVPEQINLEKRTGEPITIELQKTLGKPVVVRAY